MMTEKKQQILIVLHQHNSTSGKLGHLLQAKGFHLDKRRPRFGDRLPETLDDHAGAIVFGGPMSANDKDDFVKREIDWINVPLAEGAPFLGICLGAQMMVKTLGGAVEPHPKGCAEIGFYPLEPTEQGRALGDWPHMVYQWHREGFELPSGSALLAGGETFENQAFLHGPAAIGIQFHSELTYAMACRWTVRGAERMTLPGAKPRPDHMANWFRYDPPIRAWLDTFLDTWLALDQRGVSVSDKATVAA